MQYLDWIVIALYLLTTIGLGVAFRHQKSSDEFFSASRSMGIIPVGLSVMATLFSSNSFVMYPGATFGSSLRVGLSLLAFLLMAPLVMKIFIPVYARCNCRTAYEYLDQRYHVSVRCLASGLFILLRIGWMASATFSASLVVSVVSGLDQVLVIVVLGLACIAYTTVGGLRAVMWTDVLQFFVFTVSIVTTLGLIAWMQPGGVSSAVSTYFTGREHLLVDFSPSLILEYGSWAILIGVFLEAVSGFGADQVAVQRYIAAKSVQTTQKAFLLNLAGMFIVLPSLLCIGVGMFAHYQQHPEELRPIVGAGSENMTDAELQAAAQTPALRDRAMPTFVRTHFPPGMMGLFLVALMSAVMSSIDSGIHSVTTALVVDFRDRLLPHLKPQEEARDVALIRTLTFLIGGLAVTLACFVGNLGDVFTIGKKTTSAFGGPLLAVFILGLFSPRTRTVGVFTGTLAAAAITMGLMTYFPEWFAVWFWPIGFGLAMILSWTLNLFFPRSSGNPDYTFAAINRRASAPSE